MDMKMDSDDSIDLYDDLFPPDNSIDHSKTNDTDFTDLDEIFAISSISKQKASASVDSLQLSSGSRTEVISDEGLQSASGYIKLKKDARALRDERDQLKKENSELKANISKLYLAVVASSNEIQRKDAVIARLREQLSDVFYQKQNHAPFSKASLDPKVPTKSLPKHPLIPDDDAVPIPFPLNIHFGAAMGIAPTLSSVFPGNNDELQPRVILKNPNELSVPINNVPILPSDEEENGYLVSDSVLDNSDVQKLLSKIDSALSQNPVVPQVSVLKSEPKLKVKPPSVTKTLPKEDTLFNGRHDIDLRNPRKLLPGEKPWEKPCYMDLVPPARHVEQMPGKVPSREPERLPAPCLNQHGDCDMRMMIRHPLLSNITNGITTSHAVRIQPVPVRKDTVLSSMLIVYRRLRIVKDLTDFTPNAVADLLNAYALHVKSKEKKSSKKVEQKNLCKSATDEDSCQSGYLLKEVHSGSSIAKERHDKMDPEKSNHIKHASDVESVSSRSAKISYHSSSHKKRKHRSTERDRKRRHSNDHLESDHDNINAHGGKKDARHKKHKSEKSDGAKREKKEPHKESKDTSNMQHRRPSHDKLKKDEDLTKIQENSNINECSNVIKSASPVANICYDSDNVSEGDGDLIIDEDAIVETPTKVEMNKNADSSVTESSKLESNHHNLETNSAATKSIADVVKQLCNDEDDDDEMEDGEIVDE